MDLAGRFLQCAIMSIDAAHTPQWAVFKEMIKCSSQDEVAGGISLTVPSIG